MLDFVVTALVLIVPALAWSIWLVKARRNYALHRTVQLVLGGVLLAAVLAFEVDTRFVHGGWERIINKDAAAPRMSPVELDAVRRVLYGHLVFAVTTPVVWAVTIGLALRRFDSPPRPGRHSELHKKLGWLAAIDLLLTTVTGLWFYYLAFIAG
jgi:hypothetical protein